MVSKPQNSAKLPHISEQPITLGNWHRHIDWLNVYFVIGIPLIGFAGAYFVPLHPYTLIFAVIYYFNTGLGITAGTLFTLPHIERNEWTGASHFTFIGLTSPLQGIIDYGHTHPTRQLLFSNSTSQPAVLVQSRDRFAGGPAVTEHIIDTPIPNRTRTLCERAFYTRTLAGWS